MLALKITRLFQALLHQAFGTTDDDPKAMTWLLPTSLLTG
jgi:hypothetical protein